MAKFCSSAFTIDQIKPDYVHTGSPDKPVWSTASRVRSGLAWWRAVTVVLSLLCTEREGRAGVVYNCTLAVHLYTSLCSPC